MVVTDIGVTIFSFMSVSQVDVGKIYKICMKNASDVNAWKKNLKSLKKDATRIEILKGEQALCAVAKAEVADIEEYCSKN